MPFGVPCDDTPNPADAYTASEQIQSTLTGTAADLINGIDGYGQQINAAINEAIAPLVSYVQKVLTNNQRIINDVFRLLTMDIASQAATVDAGTMMLLQEIGSLLNLSQQDVLYGPYPQPANPPVYPPSTVPNHPPLPTPGPPGYPPGYSPSVPVVPGQPTVLPLPPSLVGPGGQPIATVPQLPPSYTQPFPPPGPPLPPYTVAAGDQSPVTIVLIDGNAVAVSPLCPPVPAGPNVFVAGNEYAPNVTVVNNGKSLSFGPGGSPAFTIGYDVQPDGKIAVHVGPISVVLSAPPTANNPDAPACQLVPR